MCVFVGMFSLLGLEVLIFFLVVVKRVAAISYSHLMPAAGIAKKWPSLGKKHGHRKSLANHLC